ncbi:MAG: hypothetical protein IPL95_09275 [Saprospiraceae bacterium]|nr:hypothetical protein [Saprospiraceae bacterium]
MIYTSALVKRHAAMRDNDSDGKEDIGAIYVLTSTGSAMLWHDLSDLGIDFGLSLMPTISTRALPTTLTGPTHDPAMFPLVGKIGIGGIELSDDFSKMYVMNLYDKKIYTIDVENKSLLATSSAVPNPCNSGVGNVRPFALKYHRGKLYVGAICDAITSQNKNDLNAVVYSYDGTSFTSVLNFPLTYNKGYAFKDLDDNNGNGIKEEFGKQWNPWLDVMPPVIMAQSTADLLSYPQPMLVDLEFDVDESMIIVFNDRAGHQLGYRNFGTNTSSNKLYSALVGGDILRAAPTGSTFVLENNASVGGVTTAGANNGQGPGGGEFYFNDGDQALYHAEDIIGGSMFFPGKREVAVVVTDPIDYWTGGVYFMDNKTGSTSYSTDTYQLYVTHQDETKYGKANGLGDMEILSEPPPIEIGNRVWVDDNGNGIQDAGEAALQGVIVQLLKEDGSLIAFATTDSNGNYIFSSAPGASSSAYKYGLTILQQTKYIVRIPNVQGGSKQAVIGSNVLTTVNSDNTTNGDVRDSDGSLNVNSADVTITTGIFGENNHTWILGFHLHQPAQFQQHALQYHNQIVLQ